MVRKSQLRSAAGGDKAERIDARDDQAAEHQDRDDAVDQAGQRVRADDLALVAHRAGGGAGRDDVVHADHVARGAADVLQRDDQHRAHLHELRGLELQTGEQRVRDGVGAGHERAEHADDRRDDDVGALEDVGQRLRHDIEHGLVREDGVHAGVAVDVNHRDAEEQRDGGAGGLLEGVDKRLLDLLAGHSVDEEREDAHEDEREDARAPAPVPGPVDVLVAEDVLRRSSGGS